VIPEEIDLTISLKDAAVAGGRAAARRPELLKAELKRA